MKSTLRRTLAVITLSSAGVLFQACGPAYDLYCNIPARFVVSNVLSVSPTLYRSCTSLGEFCTITNPAGDALRIHFKSINTSDAYNKTALQDRTIVLGLGGLIVGLPSIADEIGEEPKVVCYDLVCRNCYNDYNISHLMQYTQQGYVYCTSCKRSYDLNNGIVSSGESGAPLFRYPVNYNNNTYTLSIVNR